MTRAKILARRVKARALLLETAKLNSELVWFCVPDSQIANVADRLSEKNWKARFAFHSSGVLASGVLLQLRDKGAAVASVHPLMTFIDGALPDLEGVTFAVEGDARAVKLATSVALGLKAVPRPIRKQDKAAYHAFATMICPLLVALLAAAENAARVAGVSHRDARKRMLPIINQTVANYFKAGPAKAFTGPIARGDADSVRLHLEALAKSPSAWNAYVALAQAALEVLPSRNREDLRNLIASFSSRSLR